MATVEIKDIEGMPTLRIACTCRDLSHHLDICIDKELGDSCYIEVNTAEHAALHWYGWEKVRAMWRLLWNRPICCGGVVVRERDLKDIVEFIERNL